MTVSEGSASSMQKEVDKAADFGLFPSIELEFLGDSPVAISVAPTSGELDSNFCNALTFILDKLLGDSANGSKVLFRAVRLANLERTLTTGCDVVPSDSPIFASEFVGKAFEYGGGNKAVLAYDATLLKKTFLRVKKTELRDDLLLQYPHVVELDEEWLHLSRLLGTGRFGESYEEDYAYWIPSDPLEALRVVFLVGTDLNELRSAFAAAIDKRSLLP